MSFLILRPTISREIPGTNYVVTAVREKDQTRGRLNVRTCMSTVTVGKSSLRIGYESTTKTPPKKCRIRTYLYCYTIYLVTVVPGTWDHSGRLVGPRGWDHNNLGTIVYLVVFCGGETCTYTGTWYPGVFSHQQATRNACRLALWSSLLASTIVRLLRFFG